MRLLWQRPRNEVTAAGGWEWGYCGRDPEMGLLLNDMKVLLTCLVFLVQSSLWW